MKLDQLNTEVVKEVVKIAKEEGVSQITLEAKDFKLSVQFPLNEDFLGKSYQGARFHDVEPSVHFSATDEQLSERPSSKKETDSSRVSSQNKNLHDIKSPFVGTFYASPAPDKPPYIKVGDRISIGQAMCVLEAMKIMNEIDSDVNGEVIEICVDNESLVEYGQTLFRIRI